MWNRLNVAGMRQRWASQEDDPGRLARPSFESAGTSSGRGEDRVATALQLAFLARDILLDCPQQGCPGMLLTGLREIERQQDGTARVVLRCTRQPEDHEFTIAIPSCTADEEERLRTSQSRGEQLLCVRCRTPLAPDPPDENGAGAKSSGQPRAHTCPWCGVRWAPTGEPVRGLTTGALVG